MSSLARLLGRVAIPRVDVIHAAQYAHMGVRDRSRRADELAGATRRTLSSLAAPSGQHDAVSSVPITDRIVMRGLQFFGKHGVLPEVRARHASSRVSQRAGAQSSRDGRRVRACMGGCRRTCWDRSLWWT